mmetsp:Transcript_23872/g.38952  ORF Transcript_23872/g.38952 Transcript_23872/m.38952 type:complete len:258 (+) Transcript_23872:1976-2749(+)
MLKNRLDASRFVQNLYKGQELPEPLHDLHQLQHRPLDSLLGRLSCTLAAAIDIELRTRCGRTGHRHLGRVRGKPLLNEANHWDQLFHELLGGRFTYCKNRRRGAPSTLANAQYGTDVHRVSLRGQHQTLRPQLSSRRQEAQQGARPTTNNDAGNVLLQQLCTTLLFERWKANIVQRPKPLVGASWHLRCKAAEVVATLCRRLRSLLGRRGLWQDVDHFDAISQHHCKTLTVSLDLLWRNVQDRCVEAQQPLHLQSFL